MVQVDRYLYVKMAGISIKMHVVGITLLCTEYSISTFQPAMAGLVIAVASIAENSLYTSHSAR